MSHARPLAHRRAVPPNHTLDEGGVGDMSTPIFAPCSHDLESRGTTTSTWCPAALIHRAITNMLRSRPPQPLEEVKKHMLFLFKGLSGMLITFGLGEWSVR